MAKILNPKYKDANLSMLLDTSFGGQPPADLYIEDYGLPGNQAVDLQGILDTQLKKLQAGDMIKGGKKDPLKLGVAAPDFRSIVDPKTGQLLPQYSANFEGLQQRLLGQAQAQNVGQAAQARSQLATRGGLSSGARERIASGFGRQGALQAQDIRSQIGTQGEQMNLQSRMTDLQRMSEFEQAQYQKQLDMAGGIKMAKEQAKASKSGGGK